MIVLHAEHIHGLSRTKSRENCILWDTLHELNSGEQHQIKHKINFERIPFFGNDIQTVMPSVLNPLNLAHQPDETVIKLLTAMMTLCMRFFEVDLF